ncbi:lycopene beta-cyclase CrtY [Gilvimarinus sp. F26214L]|uniref:lycopene beta-cyclase CrtY n=1 Tax=Gilvimarinus sp. DZF01 TaxID=3461371 RepID=UPI00404668E0
MQHTTEQTELIIVGAGLSGLLTAWFRLIEHPGERILVLEAAPQAAGSHTWSFNLSDIDAPWLHRLEPFIVHRWPGYSVRFPRYSRHLPIPYATGNSASLLVALRPFVEAGSLSLRTESPAVLVEPTAVQLADGTRLTANAVLDARGGLPQSSMLKGYQKFVGHRVRTRRPHGLAEPLLMDATVEQRDGFRFIYCLPYTTTELLIEDTCYSDSPALDEEKFAERIAEYAHHKAWEIQAILHREKGVLPINLAQPRPGSDTHPAAAPRIGLGAGFFQPTTGYSLPDAVRLAARIAKLPHLTSDALSRSVSAYARDKWQRERFYRRLNRMLFSAAEPALRYRVLEHFYALNSGSIQRFYAGDLTTVDKIRLLSGRPPVPVWRALQVINERRFLQRHKVDRPTPVGVAENRIPGPFGKEPD